MEWDVEIRSDRIDCQSHSKRGDFSNNISVSPISSKREQGGLTFLT